MITLPSIPMRDETTPEWAAVLQECGWPTEVVVLDFETYFDSGFSLRKMSQIEHICDDRFEVLCLAYCHLSKAVPAALRGGVAWNVEHLLTMMQMQYGEDLEGCTIVAHNAAYELQILAKAYGIFPRFPIDTLGLARHINSRARNDLDRLAKRYDVGQLKGDTKQFKGWSRRPRLIPGKKGNAPTLVPPMSADQREKLGDYARGDSEIEAGLLAIMLPCLSRPHVELELIKHTLELYTKPKVWVDQAFAAQLRTDMEAELSGVIEATGHNATAISGNNSCRDLICAALKAAGDDPRKATKRDKKGKSILAMAQTDPERDMLLDHPDPVVSKLAKARVAIKSWPNHISRVVSIANMGRLNEGPFPLPLKYHGAHTGRWSGDEGVNAQNLSSRNESQLVNSIRGLLVPPPGMKFAIVDFSAVEARGVAWIAGQWDMCDLFRSGADLYLHYAGKMAGRQLRKAVDNDPPPVASYFKRMRNMGKVQVLGGGYGMGPDKCQGFASNTYGVELTPEEAKQLIYTYRDSVPKIVRFWGDIERAFKWVCKYGKETSLDRGLKLWKDGDTVVIQLPSGRTLKYEKAEVHGQGRDEHIVMPHPTTHQSIYMWGGYLTENIVQAFCRDLLADALLELERRGYPVAFHVHDEIICITTDERADETLAVMTEVMSKPPVWGPEFPVGCEGLITDRYGGH